MRPRIASAINSQVQMHAFFSFCNESYHSRLDRGYISSYSGNISFPFFIAKNATVTAYLLESFLARFKKVVCCFIAIRSLPGFK